MNLKHLDAATKQRLLLGLYGVMALVLLITVITLIQNWHNDWVLAHKTLTANKVTKANESEDILTAIPKEHLFGESLSGKEVPITNLELRVTGIVKTNSDQSKSSSKAYISISGQPSKIYQTGDSLPYGVKVYDITSDAVILQNDGHLEKLPLPRAKLQFKTGYTKEHE